MVGLNVKPSKDEIQVRKSRSTLGLDPGGGEEHERRLTRASQQTTV